MHLKKIMTLKEILAKVKLENNAEEKVIAAAIASLDRGTFEPKVLSELKAALQDLANKKELSKAGISFYFEISKPGFNLNSDLAKSSMTWF